MHWRGDGDTPAKTECPWLSFHEQIAGGGVNVLGGGIHFRLFCLV